MKNCISIMLVVLLTGCKVEITVPEGGAVEGFSLHGCGERQQCTIDVDHIWFWNRFSAVPNENFEFAGWKKADRYFCGGKQASCELSTLSFAGTVLEAFLYNESVFYLEPVFLPKYTSYVSELNENISIRTSYRQINYPADFSSNNAAYDSSQSPNNPMEFRYPDGSKPLGFAGWNSNWNWSWNWSGPSEMQCKMTRFEMDVEFTTTLPAPIALGVSVDALEYYWDITLHEAGHHRIVRSYIATFPDIVAPFFQTFRATSAEICAADLERRLSESVAAARSIERAQQEEFHSYDYITTWGECEDANPYMTTFCPADTSRLTP